MKDGMPDDVAQTARAMAVLATTELIRIRAELDAVSRLLRSAHVQSGSTATRYRQGETWEDLVIAGDAIDAAANRTRRFLDAQVIALRCPVATLDEVYGAFDAGGDRRDIDDA